MHLKALKELDRSEGTVRIRQSGDGALVLVPQPSPNDPNDPLRWPLWKKHTAFGAVCAFTFLTNYGISGLAPAFGVLAQEFHKSPGEVADLLLWPLLVLGIFNFFWVPIANYFGKRPVFIFASLLLFLTFIWGARAQTFRSLLWSNIISAFAGSSTEALGAAIVNDLYFLHERGTKLSIYMNFIAGGNTIGPLICGFVAENVGWRWHKGVAAIATGITFATVVFLVPETQFTRNLDAGGSALSDSEAEKGVPVTTEVAQKTFWQELSLTVGMSPGTNIFELFVRPFPLIVYPAVLFAFLGYAVSLAWVVAINIMAPFILEAPPYLWGTSLIGLINLAGFLGNVFGSVIGGWCVDRYSDWRARKNNGVFEPEMRLFLLILPALIVPAGCLVFGYGVGRSLHWTALFFGFGMISLGLVAVPIIGMTYVSDCYFPVASDALLLVNGLKNIVAFGFVYGVVPWVTGSGYVNAFGTQAGVFVAIMALAIPLALYGARIRHRTSQWRIIL
ncbi:MFS general substrate transporter [Trichodelitschia bisporula]|uniref:MFS general substrate transporter n=1 Tax=Trichodelitschia bisporula TaxID=703511 RepID=A0A6G1HWB7_9PEZI|nr:MFS general substrate transporter [Trichodelitschia bisporula]